MCDEKQEIKKIREQECYIEEARRINRENAENLQKQTEFLERIAKSLEAMTGEMCLERPGIYYTRGESSK